MWIKFLSLIVSMGVSFSATAALNPSTYQNGGDLVVCKNGEIESFSLLDYFEAELVASKPVDEAPKAIGLSHQLKKMLGKVYRYHPAFIGKLLSQTDRFVGRIQFVEELPDQELKSETQTLKLPENCRLNQLAMFHFYQGQNQWTFLIQKGMYSQLKRVHQLGLILHGLIKYMSMNGFFAASEYSIRSLNYLIAGGGPDRLGLKEYVEKLAQSYEIVKEIVFQGQVFQISRSNPFILHTDKQLAQGTLPDDVKSYKVKWGKELEATVHHPHGRPITLQFYSSGVPRQLDLKDQGLIPVQGQWLKFEGRVFFYENGHVKLGQFLSKGNLNLTTRDGMNKKFHMLKRYRAKFEKNGLLAAWR